MAHSRLLLPIVLAWQIPAAEGIAHEMMTYLRNCTQLRKTLTRVVRSQAEPRTLITVGASDIERYIDRGELVPAANFYGTCAIAEVSIIMHGYGIRGHAR